MAALAQATSDLELTYFNGRGLAETSRLIMAVAGESFKDTRYPLKVIDFASYQFDRAEFDEDKKAGKLDASIGKVPFLRTAEGVVSQSKAIERYLARRFKLMGSTELEAAQIDAFCEHVRDIKTEYQVQRKIKDEIEKKDAIDGFFRDFLPERLGLIDKTLDADAKYVIGSSLSLADLTLFSLVQFFDNKVGIHAALDKAPKLQLRCDLVSKDVRVQNWVKTRPVTPF